jgi:hypothetical protein
MDSNSSTCNAQDRGAIFIYLKTSFSEREREFEEIREEQRSGGYGVGYRQ